MTAPTPLEQMTASAPAVLWNDSADPRELGQSIAWGAVGATCNPVIAVTCVKADLPRWQGRMREIAAARPTATESQIGWQVVEEVSLEAARMLEPAFERHQGRNGRLSMQTDPRRGVRTRARREGEGRRGHLPHGSGRDDHGRPARRLDA